MDAAVAQTISRLGRLDILVSNAGICPFVEFLDLDNPTWQKTIPAARSGWMGEG